MIIAGFSTLGDALMQPTNKSLNSFLALVATFILIIPTKIGLDLLVWIGEAQLSFIRADAEGAISPLNFGAKLGLWLTDFIKVWVVAFCQATGPVFISFWLFKKWNKVVAWHLVCLLYAIPLASLSIWLVPDQTLAFFAGGSVLVYVGIAYLILRGKTMQEDNLEA